ncbi:MAG TPA: xanthine dehydrogenase family protein molybdopterin-binding subunit [Methylomirabilota bacterium]|jgi:carbon-monoxide dehydrogenase large subunit
MTRFGIGQPVRRVEDQRFLTGRGRYVDDITLPRQAYGAVVLSPHPHARIARIDISRAQAADGVLAVLTGADAVADGLGGLPPLFMPEDRGGPKGHRTFRPILAADRVRHVGDRVAFVVAETAAQARDGAELVSVDYEPLPAVVHVEDAVADGAVRVWDDAPGNVCVELRMGDATATEAAFARARHVVSLRLENQRVSANALEPRCAIGAWDADGSCTLYTSTQNPHGVRTTMAQKVFRQPETKVRVIAPDVGGGFGMKGDGYPEDALVLWASRRCRRPVKWTATRSESLLGDAHGRDQVVYGEMALDPQGRILAIRARALQAFGAYVAGAAVAPLLFSVQLVPGAYAVPAVFLTTRAIFTHTSPTAPYRGAGRPEAAYLTERLLDRAAVITGLDAVELRRRNFIRPEAMPYRIPTGLTYDSGEFAQLTDRCLELADWKGFEARRAASTKRGTLRGRGFAYSLEESGVFNERMELRCDPSGTVTIVAGTFSHGQGHATVYAQMVAEWLGVPFEHIRFVQGDTDQVPFGRGTYASRSSMVGGNALRLATQALIEKATPVAAHLLEAAPADIVFTDGAFRVVGTDRAIPFTAVARASYAPAGPLAELGIGLEASGSFGSEPPNFPNAAHACEVEVDPETGQAALARYTIVDDVGRALNPLICEGQLHGGLAQGIGQALAEHVVYDRASGQLLSSTFAEYGMPRGDDLPSFTVALAEIPCTTNPLGVKGLGEVGSVGAPPAVIHAILDALRPLGVEAIDMPAIPARIREAVHRARAEGRSRS